MIVENKEKAIETAFTISNRLIDLMKSEALNYGEHADPAEQIYLHVHIISLLLSQMIIQLVNYGKIYGIDNLTLKSIKDWVETTTEEYIRYNKALLNN
jgi:hypothetical protein